MDSLLVFYFFILLIFLKSINIDYRLIIFVIILSIFYNYHYSKIEDIDDFEKSIKSKGNVNIQANGIVTIITVNKAGNILLILRS